MAFDKNAVFSVGFFFCCNFYMGFQYILPELVYVYFLFLLCNILNHSYKVFLSLYILILF